jgi:putative nucleotidyltransferase with HDIG domain
MDKEIVKKSLIFVLLGLVYFVAGKLGLSLAEINPSISTVWAPTGIVLAAFLYFSYQYWPAVLAAAFLVNFTTTYDIPSSGLIAFGNTLEGVVGAYFINRFAGGKYFYNQSINVKKFIFFTMLATMISATIGVTALTLGGFDSWAVTALAWLTWWLGDMGGAIIFTPLLLLLFDKKSTQINKKQALEKVLFLICLVGTSIIVFGNVFKNHPLGFLLIPLLVWPGLRFSQRESAFSTFLVATIAIAATIAGTGPFNYNFPKDTLLMLQAYLSVIAITTLILAAIVAERHNSQVKLKLAYDQALEGWSQALDLRDKETEGHAERVADLSVKLAGELGVSNADLVHVRRGALLHDIGKMAIPDNILYKPGPLTEEEWVVMRRHPSLAAKLLDQLSYFDEAKCIPLCHHEKWDGSGYPAGIKGQNIPLFARIFTIVDVWDALRSHRPYRVAFSDNDALDHMDKLSGTHFDPQLFHVFKRMIKNQS